MMRFGTGWPLWLWLLVLTACATGPLSPEAERALLQKRVEARWDAVLRGDYDLAYDFATPSYRKVYSRKHFFNQYARQVEPESVKVVKIEFQNPERTVARVWIDLGFSATGWGSNPVIHTSTVVKETWVKEEGRWWRVEER